MDAAGASSTRAAGAVDTSGPHLALRAVQMSALPLALWPLAVAGAALVLTQSSLTATARAWLAAHVPFLGKLASCPMCSGFWLGVGGALVAGARTPGTLVLAACAGSILAALGVAAWLWLGETTAAIGLWRYLHSPPIGVHHERAIAAQRLNTSPDAIRCPRADCARNGGEECVFQ